MQSIEYANLLNKQFQSMKQAMEHFQNEKAMLERSLRQETQLNEELTLKVQILKDAMERKVTNDFMNSKGQTLKKGLVYNSQPSDKHSTINPLSGSSKHDVSGFKLT